MRKKRVREIVCVCEREWRESVCEFVSVRVCDRERDESVSLCVCVLCVCERVRRTKWTK